MRKKRKAPFCFLIGSIPRKMPSLSNHSQKMLFTFKDLPGGCKAHDDEKHIWDCAFFDSEWTWKDLAGNLARSCSVLKSTAERQQRKTWNKPLLGGFNPSSIWILILFTRTGRIRSKTKYHWNKQMVFHSFYIFSETTLLKQPYNEHSE